MSTKRGLDTGVVVVTALLILTAFRRWEQRTANRGSADADEEPRLR